MKILAPVTSVREAKTLIGRGAEELYCGLHPVVWEKSFGKQVWLNRRGPGAANIESLAELKRLTGLAHSNNVHVFLTVNLPFYPPEQYKQIISLIEQVTAECGVDALVISDPGLMTAIKESIPGVVIHASSMAAILNSASVAFFREIGASRIIFPRYLDLDVLRETIQAAPGNLEYEVFILNDGCVFEEGFCHVSHAFGGAFCHNPEWQYKVVPVNGQEQADTQVSFDQHLQDYHDWLRIGIRNCGGGRDRKGHPLGMCGLCALPELKALGVSSLKIVGREACLAKKVYSVTLVRKALDRLETGCNPDEFISWLKEYRGVNEYCESGKMCYFR